MAALVALALALAAAPALGAATFYIRGGGNGHGIGMSQYGAYGYALHGRGYRWILGHYYQGTALGAVSPVRVVRVLIGTGRSRSAAPPGRDRRAWRPGSATACVRARTAR